MKEGSGATAGVEAEAPAFLLFIFPGPLPSGPERDVQLFTRIDETRRKDEGRGIKKEKERKRKKGKEKMKEEKEGNRRRKKEKEKERERKKEGER